MGVLVRVLGGRFAAPTLDAALSGARLSARDAGLTTHIVYGSLRFHLALEASLTPLLRGNTPRGARALLLAGAYEKLYLGTPAHAVVNEYVALARRDLGGLSGLVNAVLRRVERPPEIQETEFNLPGWLIQSFENAYGIAAEDVMRDLLTPAPLWLWLTDQGVRDLEREGAVVEPGYGDVYRVSLAHPLRESAAYKAGRAQPINPASFSVVAALGEVAGRRVLDLAGGAGVKAAMLALRGARVTSVDLDARKLPAARANLKRLGVTADFESADLRQVPDLAPADLVLLDAPCSGSGTLRAHPEIKLRLTEGAVSELAALQSELLTTAAALTAPGGKLVYSVCSVTGAEGPGVIRDFLGAHPDFEHADAELTVPSLPADFGRRTLATHGLDGFFVAGLRRRG